MMLFQMNCVIYKTTYSDLGHFNNDQLREHWINYGRHKKRTFPFPVCNIYFDYNTDKIFGCKNLGFEFLIPEQRIRLILYFELFYKIMKIQKKPPMFHLRQIQ